MDARPSLAFRHPGSVAFGRTASVLVIAAGALVLCGWCLEVPALVRVDGRFPAMHPMTAAAFVLAGLATALLAPGPDARYAAHGRLLALVVALIGGLRFAGPTPIGDALAGFLAAAWAGRPGWASMAPGTGGSFLLVGLGLAIMDLRRVAGPRWSQSLLLAAMAPAFLSLALFLYRAPVESDLTLFQPMAVLTALSFLALGCAGLVTRPDGSVMAVVTGDSPHHRMFRLALPVLVVVPLALGALHAPWATSLMEDGSQSAAVEATVTAMLLASGLWLLARGLARAERKVRRAERALADSRLRLDLVLRGVGVGVWDWDLVRDVVKFEDTAADLWSLPRGRPASIREVLARLPEDDRGPVLAGLRAALAAGDEYAGSHRLTGRDGRERMLSVRGAVERDPAGNPLRLTGILWDTTAQHESEMARDRLRQQELDLRDQFLSHVSHELRSPLTVVYSFVEILLDGLAGELNEQQRDFLGITHRNAAQLRQMIDDLLEVTRAQTGKLTVNPRRMDLAAEVRATVEGFGPQAGARRIGLRCEVVHEPPPVLADPVRVRQVLVNLLDNALKFTPEGGGVHVRIRTAPNGDDVLAVSVVDEGPGIPEPEREHIFRQLYQLDCAAPAGRRGLGLGLYICRELVTRMGGRIWVEAGPGGGSAFTFTLPRHAPARAIEALLTRENLARGRFHLVIATLRPNTARPWTEREDGAARTVLEVVRSCSLPDRDLVLPRLGEANGAESLVVLACADAGEAASLRRRIENQLTRTDALGPARVTCVVRTRELDVAAPRGATLTQFADGLASCIEAALAAPEDRREAA